MKSPTLQAIANKVIVRLSAACVMIVVGISYSSTAAAQSMTDSEYKFLQNNIEVEFNAAKKRCNLVPSVERLACISLAESNKNASKLELDIKRKVVTENETSLKSKVDLGAKSRVINAMPVMSSPTLAFKQTRLI